MSKDKFQDKYTEIFKDLKEEKMNWDFDDFLQKAENLSENQAEIFPITGKKNTSSKWMWIAASVVLIFSLSMVFNLFNTHTSSAERSQLVENEILKQKKDFFKENFETNEKVAVNFSDSISGAKKDSVFQENTLAEADVLDEILSKRSRIKKQTKPRFVDNSSRKILISKDSTGYQSSFVIVNGKKIDNMEEAINVTKYSFQVVANNLNQSLSQPKVIDDGDY